MSAYEYTTSVIHHGLLGRKSDEIDPAELTTALNELGAQGWELDKLLADQAIHGGKDGHLLIFKRELA
jgi:Domain of unknown function (DUF4177)